MFELLILLVTVLTFFTIAAAFADYVVEPLLRNIMKVHRLTDPDPNVVVSALDEGDLRPSELRALLRWIVRRLQALEELPTQSRRGPGRPPKTT